MGPSLYCDVVMIEADRSDVMVRIPFPSCTHVRRVASMYQGRAKCMEELFAHQLDVIGGCLKELNAAEGSGATYVEVGSGTNEAGARLLESSKDMKHYVGLDLARAFLEWSQKSYPQLNDATRSTLIHGNACHTAASMAGLVPDSVWNGPRLMGLVMNTIGVLPESIRQDVVRESVLCAGVGGTVLVGCWWSGAFKRGVEEFYKMNPALCGEVTDDMVDLENATLLNPSTGYSSQWWSEERVQSLFEGVVPVGDMVMSTHGVGVFAKVRVTELHVAAAAALRPEGADALAKYPGYGVGAAEIVQEVMEAAPAKGVMAAASGGGDVGQDTEDEDSAEEEGSARDRDPNMGAEVVPPLVGSARAKASRTDGLGKRSAAYPEEGGAMLSTADSSQ